MYVCVFMYVMNERTFISGSVAHNTNRHTNTQTDRTDRIHSAYRTRLKSITKILNYSNKS